MNSQAVALTKGGQWGSSFPLILERGGIAPLIHEVEHSDITLLQ